MSLSRRGFITAAAGLGVGTALAATANGPVAGANPLATGSLGDIAAGSLEAVDTGSGMISPRGPLGMVGVTFPSAEDIAGRIRFAFDDGSLGQWQPLRPLDGGRDGGNRAAAELVMAPQGATSFEVEAPRGTQATVLDDGRHGPAQNYAGLRRVDMLGVPVVPRSAWGADDNAAGGWAPEFFLPQCITIHHTAMHCGPDRVGNLRSIFNYHANVLGWGDIGYHLVIDPDGVVYQGRRTAIPDQPVFKFPPIVGIGPSVVTGGHTRDVNNGNIGISLLGDFTSYAPTAAAVGACIDVVRALSNAIGINPRTHVTYRNPVGGYQRVQRAVSGHRDWGGTSCPGNAFYPQLDFIRDTAAAGYNPGVLGLFGPLNASPFGSAF